MPAYLLHTCCVVPFTLKICSTFTSQSLATTLYRGAQGWYSNTQPTLQSTACKTNPIKGMIYIDPQSQACQLVSQAFLLKVTTILTQPPTV